MQKIEAKFTLLFRHWLKANPMASGAFELKQCGNMIPFDAVKEHQIDALTSCESPTGMLYKIPDDSRGIKPCDLVYLRNAPSFVVILYKTSKFFVIIPVKRFIKEACESKRRSLTADRARAIGTAVVEL